MGHNYSPEARASFKARHGKNIAKGTTRGPRSYNHLFNIMHRVPFLIEQTEKFDKQLQYIRKWIPELDSLSYPQPIVVHEEARVRVLAAYAKALKP